jgi:hypothetical protein
MKKAPPTAELFGAETKNRTQETDNRLWWILAIILTVVVIVLVLYWTWPHFVKLMTLPGRKFIEWGTSIETEVLPLTWWGKVWRHTPSFYAKAVIPSWVRLVAVAMNGTTWLLTLAVLWEIYKHLTTEA